MNNFFSTRSICTPFSLIDGFGRGKRPAKFRGDRWTLSGRNVGVHSKLTFWHFKSSVWYTPAEGPRLSNRDFGEPLYKTWVLVDHLLLRQEFLRLFGDAQWTSDTVQGQG